MTITCKKCRATIEIANSNYCNNCGWYIFEAKKVLYLPDIAEIKSGGETFSGCYGCLSYMIGFLTFAGCWIYCISTYGFLFGVGLGWLPAIICAGFAALLWPLAVVAVGILFIFNWK